MGQAMSNKGVPLPKPKKQRRKVAKKEGISLLGVTLGVATLIGGIAAVVTFFPRVTVNISDPVDPNDPFSSTLTVANTGYIPLDSVGFAVALRNISVPSGAGFVGGSDYTSLLAPDIGKARNLSLDDKFSVPFNGVFEGDKDDLNGADLAILVFYKVPILHLQKTKLFPLKLLRQSNGNFYWFSDPQPDHYKVELKGYRISGPIRLPHRQKSN